MPRINKISVIKELGILTHMRDGDSLTVRGYLKRLYKGLSWIQVLNQIVDLACSEHRMSLERFIPYRHATLATQSGKCTSWNFSPCPPLINSSTATEGGTILSAFGSWLQALWEHDDSGGPSILFQPTELSTTIQVWWDDRHSDLDYSNVPLVICKASHYNQSALMKRPLSITRVFLPSLETIARHGLKIWQPFSAKHCYW